MGWGVCAPRVPTVCQCDSLPVTDGWCLPLISERDETLARWVQGLNLGLKLWSLISLWTSLWTIFMSLSPFFWQTQRGRCPSASGRCALFSDLSLHLQDFSQILYGWKLTTFFFFFFNQYFKYDPIKASQSDWIQHSFAWLHGIHVGLSSQLR